MPGGVDRAVEELCASEDGRADDARGARRLEGSRGSGRSAAASAARATPRGSRSTAARGFFRAVSPQGETVEIGDDAEGLLDAEGRLRARRRPLRRRRGRRGPRSRPPRRPRSRWRDRSRRASRARVRIFRRGLHCPRCGREFRDPTPPLFAFNSPLGACPGLPGIRPRDRRGSREGDPRPQPHARGAPGRAVEHAGVRVGVRRPLPRLPPVLGADGRSGLAPFGARARGPHQGPRRLLRRPGVLRLARDQALQDPRARPARALPRLHALRRLPRRAPRAAGPLGPLPGQDDRRARGAARCRDLQALLRRARRCRRPEQERLASVVAELNARACAT